MRLSEELIAEIKKYNDENGFTQAQGIAELLSIATQNKVKTLLPGQKSDIEHFQALHKQVMDAYTHALELNASAEERAKADVQIALDSKDRTIADLQKRLDEENTKVKTAEDSVAAAAENLAALQKEADQAHKDAEAAHQTAEQQKQIADEKTKLNDMLQAERTANLEKLKAAESLEKEIASKDKEIADLNHQKDLDAAEIKHLHEDLDESKAAAEKAATVLEQERGKNADLSTQLAKAEAEAEKRELQAKAAASDEIQGLKAEKAALAQQVKDLQARLNEIKSEKQKEPKEQSAKSVM